MSELVKAQYRNADLKAEAYKMAEESVKLLSPKVIAEDDNALPMFCETAAIGIISEMSGEIIKNVRKLLRAQGGKLDQGDAEDVMRKMADPFVDEMRVAGTVAMLDLRLWYNKAMVMGSNPAAAVTTMSAAWATGEPGLFRDLHQRIKKAVDGYFNSSLQTLTLFGG